MNSCVGLPVFRCTSALNNLVTWQYFKHPMNALKRTMAAEHSRDLESIFMRVSDDLHRRDSESAETLDLGYVE
jgi:hypothetical protein